MESAEFDQLIEERCAKTKQVLGSKGKEYARGDRLSNFKKAAALTGESPLKAARGFWVKHIVSMCDLVDDAEKGVDVPYELWSEKIGDSINYLILMEGLIKDGTKK
jgi:hypothetical protein